MSGEKFVIAGGKIRAADPNEAPLLSEQEKSQIAAEEYARQLGVPTDAVRSFALTNLDVAEIARLGQHINREAARIAASFSGPPGIPASAKEVAVVVAILGIYRHTAHPIDFANGCALGRLIEEGFVAMIRGTDERNGG